MRTRSGQLAFTAVVFVLGLLVVVQFRSQAASPELAGLTAADLTALIANVSARNDQLRTEAETLQVELGRLRDAEARGVTSLDQIRSDLQRVGSWSGMGAVDGPGVEIVVRGPIDGQTVQDLVNELWNSGAEAVAVETVRVVPGVVVAGPPGGLSVDDLALGDPFTIDAIGSPDTLAGSLGRIGGIISQISGTLPDVEVEVRPVDRLTIPATGRSLEPTFGHPRL